MGAAAVFGVVLATMNVVFYVAIDYLPLGTAVAIEFLGPVAVAGVTGRGWRDRLGIALAAVGVVLLAGVQLEGGVTRDVVIGLVAILGSAAAWAGYILLGRRIAVQRDGISALAVGMTAGAVVYSPLAIGAVAPVVTDAGRAAAVVGIAVLSSVIPYAIEQVVLRRVTAARFAILLALLPVTALIVGAVFLAQLPTVVEVAGMVLVCAAIVSVGPAPGRPGQPAAGVVPAPQPAGPGSWGVSTALARLHQPESASSSPRAAGGIHSGWARAPRARHSPRGFVPMGDFVHIRRRGLAGTAGLRHRFLACNPLRTVGASRSCAPMRSARDTPTTRSVASTATEPWHRSAVAATCPRES